LHGIGALLLILVSTRTTFAPFYSLLLLYALCYMPTMALTNSLSFRHMSDPAKDFGSIRVLGTLGWIVAGLLIGFAKLEATAIPMRIAAFASILMALYCLTLPHTAPLGKSSVTGLRAIFRIEAIALFRDRSFTVFAMASFLICIPLQFYYAFANPYLNEVGVRNAAAKMTMGQMSEVFFLLALPWFFIRLGVKYTLIVGMAAWSIRYFLFAFGNATNLIGMFYLAIILHGICFDFFFVTGQVYVDRKAPSGLRASAQGLITFITYGVGMFLGAWLSGRIVDLYATVSVKGELVHSWRSIWLVPAIGSAAILMAFLLTFKRKEQVAAGVADVTDGAT
jgi:nucleoside transporter